MVCIVIEVTEEAVRLELTLFYHIVWTFDDQYPDFLEAINSCRTIMKRPVFRLRRSEKQLGTHKALTVPAYSGSMIGNLLALLFTPSQYSSTRTLLDAQQYCQLAAGASP